MLKFKLPDFAWNWCKQTLAWSCWHILYEKNYFHNDSITCH